MSDYWDTDKHKLSHLNCLYCSCPYHEQLRADAEDDRREQVKTEGDDDDKNRRNKNECAE